MTAKMPSTPPASTSLAQTLLQRAHPPDTAAHIFSDKIQRRPLFLRPSSPPPAVLNARDARRRARTSAKSHRKALRPKPLSSRQRRALGLHEVARQEQKHANFAPLHRLWLGYILEVLGMGAGLNSAGPAGRGGGGGGSGGDDAAAAAKLASADMHGAEMEVVRSNCVSRVGIKGIVIKDAKFVFELVTERNRLKVVPKEGTIFRVQVPLGGREHQDTDRAPSTRRLQEVEGSPRTGKPETKSPADVQAGGMAKKPEADQEPKLVFEILGDQFIHRSADRANKKFKQHFLKRL